MIRVWVRVRVTGVRVIRVMRVRVIRVMRVRVRVTGM